MKLRSWLAYLLVFSLLVFPAVGHAYSYEVFADETSEEVVRIVESRNDRYQIKKKPVPSVSFPKAFSVWNEIPSFQEEKPYIVSKKFLILSVLLL